MNIMNQRHLWSENESDCENTVMKMKMYCTVTSSYQAACLSVKCFAQWHVLASFVSPELCISM